MINKVVFTAIRQPGIIEHNIVGWLFNPEVTPFEKAFEYVRKYNNISEDVKLFIYRTDAEIIETNADEDSFDREIKMNAVRIGPGESKYILITRSNLEPMYQVDLDGDIINVSNVEEIVSGLPELQPYERYYTGRGAYNVRNKWLQPMKHYAFDRDQLTKLFNDHIASNEKAFEILEDAIAGVDDHEIGDFRCWKDFDEEFYILHVPSGTIVGWYKFYHFGRDNFTNRDMTLDDLKDFFVLLRNQLLDEPDEPDYKEPEPEPEHHEISPEKVIECMKAMGIAIPKDCLKDVLDRVEDWDETPSYPDAPKKKPYDMDVPAIMERLRRNSAYGMLAESIGGTDLASMYPSPKDTKHPDESDD